MNLLVRIENRLDKVRIEQELSRLPFDLYFVRDDSHMLNVLEQTSFEAIVIGQFQNPRNVVLCKRLIEGSSRSSSIPIIEERNLKQWKSTYLVEEPHEQCMAMSM